MGRGGGFSEIANSARGGGGGLRRHSPPGKVEETFGLISGVDLES